MTEVELTTRAVCAFDLPALLHSREFVGYAAVLRDTIEVCLGAKQSLDYGVGCDSGAFEGEGVVAFACDDGCTDFGA